MPQPFIAAEFQMNLEVALNASFSNFLIEAEFTETTVANTRMTYNYIGLPSEDYNTLMQNYVSLGALDFNNAH